MEEKARLYRSQLSLVFTAPGKTTLPRRSARRAAILPTVADFSVLGFHAALVGGPAQRGQATPDIQRGIEAGQQLGQQGNAVAVPLGPGHGSLPEAGRFEAAGQGVVRAAPVADDEPVAIGEAQGFDSRQLVLLQLKAGFRIHRLFQDGLGRAPHAVGILAGGSLAGRGPGFELGWNSGQQTQQQNSG
jgi:hypothetical protein